MSTLAVTRSLTSNTNPTEAQFDTMRTDLLNFFNGASLDETNIAAGGMVYTSLDGPLADDVTMKWESSHATIQFISATSVFEIKNTQGDILWMHLLSDGSTLEEFLSIRESDGALEVFGVPNVNTSLGNQDLDLMWLLSRYRKPKLVYVDDDIITIEENSTGSGATRIMLRDRLTQVYDRTMSLAVTANGYGALHTGAAVSGIEDGLTRTDNLWYYIYAVEVQYGTQNDGTYSILVASVTSPVSSNITTLNTEYGTGKWIYMGCIKNGWNISGSGAKIVPFVYDENGYMRFTQSLNDNEPLGPRLASHDATATNLTYAVDISSDADGVPPVATRVIFGGYRESHGFELHYQENSTSEVHAINTGTHHVASLDTLVPCIYLEVPLLTGYNVVIIMGNVSTNKRISLAGLVDHYV